MTPSPRATLLAVVLWLTTAAAASGVPPIPGKRGANRPPPHSISRHNLAAALERLHKPTAPGATTQATVDTLRLVALPIEFPDLRMGESPPADELHDRFFFQVQFFYVRQYFEAASSGRTVVLVEVPEGVALAADEQATYGDFAQYDSLMVKLTAEAVAYFDPQVDFSAYDGFITLHAGPGQESDIAGNSPEQIWSGFVDQISFQEVLSTPDSVVLGIPTQDGVAVRECLVLPEWEVQDLDVSGGTRTGHLGVYAHEIGQKMGMIPLFDADPSPIPDSQGVGNFGLMGYGLWVANGFIPVLPCAFNRMLMGWVDPLVVESGREIVLRDQETGPPDSVVARIPISEREYFLVSYVREDIDGPVECNGTPYRRFFRFEDKNQNCRFDYEDTNGDGVMSPGDSIDTFTGAEWDFFMTDLIGGDTAGDGYGLLVLHVDELAMQEVLLAGGRNVQSNPRRKGVDVEEADTIEDLDRFPDNPRSFGSADDYFVRGHAFAPRGIPNTASANGAPTGIEMKLVALPDSGASAMDPTFGLPGERARLRLRRDAGLDPEVSPTAGPRRQWPGDLGADLVALPQASGGQALLVPGLQGAVYLLDASLREIPGNAGGTDPLAWVQVPPELQAPWRHAPAVGDVNGDGIDDVVLLAEADSMGERRTRVFAWDANGQGLGTGGASPLLADLAGTPAGLCLFDLDGMPGSEIVAAIQDSAAVRLWTSPTSCVLPDPTVGPIRPRPDLTAGPWLFAGGPVGLKWTDQACGARTIAWAVRDSLGEGQVWLLEPCCSQAPWSASIPVRLDDAAPMVAGDLDGDGKDELILLGAEGSLFRLSSQSDGSVQVESLWTLQDRVTSPLALADLDGDGTLEILAVGFEAMHVLSFSGAEQPGWPRRFSLDPALEEEVHPGAGAGTPLVADLDGNGSLEVCVHLRGGAFKVWDRHGNSQRELEAALPATEVASPWLGDLDGNGLAELAALGRFGSLVAYDAPTQGVETQRQTDVGLWSWPRLGEVAWGELGGDGSHAFHTEAAGPLQPQPNDGNLSSFVVAPNPASAVLTARVALTSDATVQCVLFNLEGEKVLEASRRGTTGEIVEFHFDVSHVASGIYLARMELSSGGRRHRPVAIRH